MSSRWKERNAKTTKDWRCEEENLCQSEEDALAWDRQLCLGQCSGQGKVGVSREKFCGRERGAKDE